MCILLELWGVWSHGAGEDPQVSDENVLVLLSPNVAQRWHQRPGMRFQASLLVLLAACTVGDPATPRGDEHAELVLEGADLDGELATSPPHKTDAPFERIGLMFDSSRPGAIELASSADGQIWSAWHAIDLRHVEAEGHSAFVGEVRVDTGPASYFRLRGTPGQATFARIDVMSGSVGAEWEGDDQVDGDGNGTQLAPAVLPALPGVTVHSRAEWGSAAANCTASHTPQKLTIHMTDTPNADTISTPARLRQIQSYHRDVRGWCDIGYHFLISRDGQIWEGRPITRLGAHTAGANTNNIGIALLGTFETVPPTAEQQAATSALLRGIGTQYNIALSRTTVKGHREQGTTETNCPGAKTFALLPKIVDDAKGTTMPPPPPPPTGDTVQGLVYRGNDPSDRIAGATVRLDDKTTTTSTDGTYEFADITAGVHQVTIEAPGFETTTISRDTGVNSWISVGLVEEASEGGTAVLQGVVYRGSDGLDRIPFATVRLSTGATATADQHGYYLITGLAPGPVTITAEADGFTAGSVSRTLVNGGTEWGSVSLN